MQYHLGLLKLLQELQKILENYNSDKTSYYSKLQRNIIL